MSELSKEYRGSYTEGNFWSKVVAFAKKAGYPVIEKALWLYYTAQSPDTPLWAKVIIYSALGYFISPLDAVPDVIPLVGFVDDLAALAAAITTVASYIDKDVKDRASQKLKDLGF